jgi:hypothetical protein
MAAVIRQTEWLSLIEVSGPFLVPRVLEEVFPQGLERVETPVRHRLREAYEEWREAVDTEDSDLEALHRAWTRLVLEECLEYDDRVLVAGDDLPGSLSHHVAEHGETIRPDLAVVAAASRGESAVLMPIFVLPPDTDLERPLSGARWPASPLERATMLCRATGVRTGLVTDGERWTLVHVTKDGVSGHASWYARLWWQEAITLQAFRSLLGVRRHFGPDDETLPALLDRSLEYQDEVTDRLGEQVLHAVEVLVQALDRADQDRQGELLRDVSPRVLYEAALTVMMRLVFLLAAEERGLLLLGDPLYDSHYAISTLRAQLRERADHEGLEVLERRWEAWSRLLATFRAVYAGVEHPTLRMPALGGSLFDPDRFPFLEGRPPGSRWRETPARPLPIDDRTVLLLLESLQVLEDRGGARLLSYRGLDVEQIGYVYEGLLEHTVARISEPTLGLRGSQKAPNPNVRLSELESARDDGETVLVKLLEERTGRSASALSNELRREVDAETEGQLLLACGNDKKLAERVRPFVHLLRDDVWGYPLVYRAGGMAVGHGADRRETGSHYTPKSLTEAIVAETLEPLVYVGPAEGEPRESWRLKPPQEILDLKICDPAMGSGAFLVQVCRYLSERLVEAWGLKEDGGRVVGMDGLTHTPEEAVEPLPKDEDERLVIARRLVAERCLYGVDVNPLAVELAKLSIWLVTLSKGRPLEFLDHNLRCGDSLLGIRDLNQLLYLDLNPDRGRHRPLFAQNIEQAIKESLEWRRTIRATPIHDVRDVRDAAEMEEESRQVVEAPRIVADALVGLTLASGGDERRARQAWLGLSMQVGPYLSGDGEAGRRIAHIARKALDTDLPAAKPPRRPFHWPLEFPEVFVRENGGFDAFVGNPPFLGGQRITGVMGTAYREWLVERLAEGRRGSADLVAYFFLRAWRLLREGGGFGLLAVNTIAEGDTRQVGLEAMVKAGAVIHAAYPNERWPGSASVFISRVHVHKGPWKGERRLSGRPVPFISAFLSDREEWTPKRLKANEGIAFQGSIVLGMGFVLTPDEAKRMLDADPKNADVIFPYLNGQDLNSDPEQRPSRWVINFWDWPEERAREYELPWKWIEEQVKPERQRRKPNGEYKLRKPLPQRWWQYAEKRPALYHAIGRGHAFERHPDGWDPATKPMERVLVVVQGTKYPAITFVSNDLIIDQACIVFAWEDYAALGLLNSSIHAAWVWKQGSKLGAATLYYTPTDVFQTFPFPDKEAVCHIIDEIDELGRCYSSLRSSTMSTERIGLTQLYNRFHDPADRDPRLEELRELHREIDVAIARAYGWDDLDLGHGFHEVPYLPENDRVRFTISEPARIKVLRRLAELNRERYEEDVRQGLHEAKPPAKPRRAVSNRPSSPEALPLFDRKEYASTATFAADLPMAADENARYDNDGPATPHDDTPTGAILAYLRAHPGWRAKRDILAATGISASRWNAAIDELLAEGKVARQGERRGTKYRACSEKRNGGNT